MKPTPEELEIRGFWIDLGSGVVPDSNWERINYLITSYLQKTRQDDIFLDPADQRKWQYLRPMPHLKDGGPPILRCIQ